ncbi:MAG: outer membrane beta-barrel protein [Mesorhizobium sp.]|nr:outer membrane beta-barrel protein [Mesorhizobium sp.]
MRTGLAALIVAGIVSVSPALAADDLAPASVFDWSGAYLGVQAGGSWANLDQRIPAYGPLPDGEMNGGLVGAFAGYNWQFHSLVAGVEIGANLRNLDGTNDILNAPELLYTKQNWDASFVARLGAPVGRTLLYGLAGVSVTEVSSQYTSGFLSADDVVAGYTVGAGGEFAFTDRVKGRLEYRFADYAEADVQCTGCGPTFVTPQTHTVTAGLLFSW